MDWIKVKVKHADYDFSSAPGEVFKSWIRTMTFVAATERIPTEQQLSAQLGKENYENLLNYIKENELATLDIIMEKVMEDVTHIVSRKEHDRKYMSKYRCKPLHKPLQSADVMGKRREEKRREDNKKKKLLSPQEFISSIKTKPEYQHINIDNELAKMDTWIENHPGRKKTYRFVLNWLNKIDIPLPTDKPKTRIIA